jgi:hypothetical protein
MGYFSQSKTTSELEFCCQLVKGLIGYSYAIVSSNSINVRDAAETHRACRRSVTVGTITVETLSMCFVRHWEILLGTGRFCWT